MSLNRDTILIDAYSCNGIQESVELLKIYECFCDRTRLRILNLLVEEPLCVGDLQLLLGEPQVKISKHLGYLRAHGLVEDDRDGNRRIYRLVSRRSRELSANLACLQDCAQEDKIFRRDREKLGFLRRKTEGSRL